MTSRERVLTALNHREPDRVPVDLSGHRSSGIAATENERTDYRQATPAQELLLTDRALMKANAFLLMSLLGFTWVFSSGCKEAGAVAQGFGYAYYGSAAAVTLADSAAREWQHGGGGPPSPEEVRRLDAQEAEILNGLPRLRVGMTVAEISTLMPRTFDKRVRKDLQTCSAFTGSLHGYKLEFLRGVLVSIEPPPVPAKEGQ